MTKAPPAPKRTTGEWTQAFLRCLAAGGVVKEACQQAGIARPAAYDRRNADAAFAAAWDVAQQEGYDELEKEARSRALLKSDKLIMFLLKAYRRDVFGDKVEITSKEDALYDEWLAQRLEGMEAGR